MARYTIGQYFKQLGRSITYSNYYTPSVALRLAVADTFGYPSDKKVWIDYVTSGEDNPIGWRGLSLSSYPYLIVGGLRSTLMKGIDWLALGRKMQKERKSPWWAIGLKGLVAALLYPVEIPCYFLAKATDKIVSIFSSTKKNNASSAKIAKSQPAPRSMKKTTKPSLFRRFINWIMPKKINKAKSTSSIEKGLSTITHNVHNHGSKTSAASNHPIFHHQQTAAHTQEYNEKSYEALKEKVNELKTDYNNTNQPDLQIASKFKELASLINPDNQETLPLRARRLEMIHKFQGGKSDRGSVYANHFKLDWENFQRLIIELEKDILKLKGAHKITLDSDIGPQSNPDPKHH
ncbi:MAG: hypothetical protein ACYCQI_08010 [Gammaproteobacteria bacterium]